MARRPATAVSSGIAAGMAAWTARIRGGELNSLVELHNGPKVHPSGTSSPRVHWLGALRLIGCLIGCVSGAACVSGPVVLRDSMNLLESPEAGGKILSGRLDLGHRSVHQATVTPDYATSSIADGQPDLASFATYGALAEIGLSERLDLGVQWANDTVPRAGFKLQLLGEPRTRAKAGGYSLALRGGLGYSSQDGASTGAKFDLNATLADVGVIAGVRPWESLLLYTGVTLRGLALAGAQTRMGQASQTYSRIADHEIFSAGALWSLGGSTVGDGPYLLVELDLARIRLADASRWSPNGAISIGWMR